MRRGVPEPRLGGFAALQSGGAAAAAHLVKTLIVNPAPDPIQTECCPTGWRVKVRARAEARPVIPLSPRTHDLAARTFDVLANRGMPAFLVGGTVRDGLLGQTTNDLDIVIDASPRDVGAELAAALGGTMVVLDVAREMVRIVVASDDSRTDIDLARLAGGDIESDLGRRDFTVDALAVELGAALSGDWDLIDPLGGVADIESRTIRAVSGNSLSDDPVRILRAVRIASKTGFTIEPGTQTMIQRDVGLLAKSSPERIREELLRTLALPGAGSSVRKMDRLGILSTLIPELDASRGVEQPKEHYYDVFGHLTAAVEFADQIVSGRYRSALVAEMMPRFAGMDDYFGLEVTDGHSRGTILKLTALLHDIAKPHTKTIEPSGRVRFFGHSEQGEEIAGNILRRLRVGRRGDRLVRGMIRHHLRPRQMAGSGELPTERAIFRYYRDLDDAALDTLYLNMADFLAARGPVLTPEEMEAQVRVIDRILKVGPQKSTDGRSRRAGLLTGHDIMSELGLEPGPAVGRLLRMVARAEAGGCVSTRGEALKLARTYLEAGDGSG